ncbi:hypothetical protein D3C81_1488050 [compost metagenome]
MINKQSQRSCRIFRPAVRHDVRLHEQLNGLYRCNRQDKHGDIVQAWDRNEAKLLKLIGSVYGGGLVQILGNPLESSQKNHHLIACRLPYGHKNDRVHRLIRAAEKRLIRNAEEIQRRIDQTLIRIVERNPKNRDDGH